MTPIAHSTGPSAQRSPLLYLTYSAARMHLLQASATYLKLRRIIADLGVDTSDRQPTHGYDLVLLYQRNRVQDPFNCTKHAPRGTSLCAEYTRADLKRAFGSEMSLSRKDNRPSRTNVGFWVCALWLIEQQQAGRNYPFVWYMEDDVLLTGSWAHFLSRYDTDYAWADMLVPQKPYPVLGWDRVSAGRPALQRPLPRRGARGDSNAVDDVAIVHGRTASTPGAAGQLSIPRSTLPARLPVSSDEQYSKVPLYMWRMSGRLVAEVASALRRGARAHEEYFVPTVCNVMLRTPSCRWKMIEEMDLGVPCASNLHNSWQRSRQPEFLSSPWANLNRSGFDRMFAQLQKPGGERLLPDAPQRLYHPVKGQLASVGVPAPVTSKRSRRVLFK